MYVWKHKNRRDRRNNLFEGVGAWVNKNSSAKQDFIDDTILREEKEELHIKYFYSRARVKMHEYLSTPNGLEEIQLVIKEIEKNDTIKKQSMEIGEISPEEAEEDRKATIYEIFKKFDADGSNSIDPDELKILLGELKVKMTDDEFEVLFASLDEDGEGEVEFEEFYRWFKGETEKKEPKTAWEKFKKALAGSFYDNFKKLVMETEARNALLDYCVNRIVENARKEFRIVHPPPFLCKICNQTFLSKELLDVHIEPKTLNKTHRAFFKQAKKDERRFHFVGNVFVGTQGRNLLARRVIFSPELAMSDDRINAASLEPYRPSLSDPSAKRKMQMDKGMLVQGHDPSVGVRPQYSHLNLIRQYRAEGKRKEQPYLEDLCMDLVHCQDLKIDVVQAPFTSAHAEVRIFWLGFSSTNVQIKGDFNGWKLEEMLPDRTVGKCCLKLFLPPGKYKYLFYLEGEFKTDPNQSTMMDPNLGLVNVIMIINPSVNRDKSVRLTEGYEPHDSWLEADGMSEASGNSNQLITMGDGGNKSLAVVESKGSPDKGVGEEKVGSPNGQLTKKKVHATDLLTVAAVKKTDHQKILDSLKHINMRNVALNDDGAWAFAQFIKFNSTIEILDLSYNGISDDGMIALAACLPDLPRMRHLLLNGNGFGSVTAKHLGLHLKSSVCITRIELSNNNLCDDGAEYISELLTNQMSIKEIFLDSCFISDFGMEFIINMLHVNRCLSKLSIKNNLITTKSAQRLAAALTQNATLLDLDISRNVLGPEGAKYFGNMLYENLYITSLDLSYTDLARHGSTMGMHALCYSLRERNRSLQYLNLGYNGLTEPHVLELAEMLMTNIYLTHIPLEGNPINNQWYLPETFIETRAIEMLPTIRTSLDRNLADRADPDKAAHFYAPLIPEIVNDVADGYWTVRRRWKAVNRKSEENRLRKAALGEEMNKIKLEEAYVVDHVNAYLDTLAYFLEEKQTQPFLAALASLISDHYYNLAKIDPNENDSELAKLQSPLIDDNQYQSSIQKSSNQEVVFRTRAQIAEDKKKEEEAKIAAEKEIERIKKEKAEKFIDFFDESFDQMHVALMAVIFKDLGADKESLLIHPEQLEKVFQHLCLPLSKEDLQLAVDNTLMNWTCSKSGFKKFCIYVKKIAHFASKKKKLQRMRYLSDLFFHPPLYEAKKMILDCITYQQTVKARKEYRHLPGKTPKYMCYYCGKRFPTDKAYQKHQEEGDSGYDHKRFHMHLAVYQAQRVVLKKAKRLFAGVFFPSFWELVPEKQLPQDYSPQVFDKMGDEGRPIGVICGDRTIRVEDMLGDYVQIAYEGGLGWTRYKLGRHKLLQTACSNVPGFTWDHVRVFETPRYYRVDPKLEEGIELKVRYLPKISGEICGSLIPGQVVECRAVLGDWLQIIFNHESVAWVVSVSHAGDHSIFATEFEKDEVFTPRTALLRKHDKKWQKEQKLKKAAYRGPRKIIDILPIPTQKKLQHVMNHSPYNPTEEDLKYPVQYDADGFKIDPNISEDQDDRAIDEILADPSENWYMNFIV